MTATEIWLQFPIRGIWFIAGSGVHVDILECFPLNWWDLWNHQDCRPSFDHSSFLSLSSLACPFRTTWNGFHPLYQEQYPQLPPPPYSEGKMFECSKFMFKNFTPQSKTSLLSPAWPPFSNDAVIQTVFPSRLHSCERLDLKCLSPRQHSTPAISVILYPAPNEQLESGSDDEHKSEI